MWLAWTLGWVLPLSGCAPANPGLESFREDAWLELGPVVVESMSGARRGADVEAVGVFTRGEDQMTLSMTFILMYIGFFNVLSAG